MTLIRRASRQVLSWWEEDCPKAQIQMSCVPQKCFLRIFCVKIIFTEEKKRAETALLGSRCQKLECPHRNSTVFVIEESMAMTNAFNMFLWHTIKYRNLEGGPMLSPNTNLMSKIPLNCCKCLRDVILDSLPHWHQWNQVRSINRDVFQVMLFQLDLKNAFRPWTMWSV